MSLDILLKDYELHDKILLAKDQYKTVLQTQRGTLKSVFGSETSTEVIRGEKASLLLAGVYIVVKNKLTTNVISQKQLNQSTQNAFALYAATEAVIQNVNLDISAFSYPSYLEQNYSKYLELNVEGFNVISQSIAGFLDYTKNHRVYRDIDFMLTHYYSKLSDAIIDYIYANSSDSISTLNDIQIVGNGFKIEGMNGVKKPLQMLSKEVRSERNKKDNIGGCVVEEVFRVEPPSTYIGQEITFNEVVGNEKAKKALKEKVYDLMSYDFTEKKNPVRKYNPKYLPAISLIGLPGCGKTLMLDAAQCYADSLSKENNISYNCVSLDFGSGTQDGPMEKLKYQLQTISNPEKIYLVFIDEAEKIFPRDTETSHGIERKVGQLMLNFINGKSFKDYGNHLLVFASNEPDIMSPALNSRLCGATKLCEGPVTEEEKRKVLFNNLKSMEEYNGLKLSEEDRHEIGKILYEFNLSGREISFISGNLIDSSRKGIEKYPKNYLQLNYLQKCEWTTPSYNIVNKNTIIAEIHNLISSREEITETSRNFRKS